jgi:hypothetical protein
MTNNIPYLRNKTPSLLVFSTAIALMLGSLILPLSNPVLLQPAQAQTVMTFKTPSPATGPGSNLAFDVYGNTSTSDPQNVKITNGTIHLQAQQRYTGEVTYGSFTNDSSGASITFSTKIDNLDYTVSSPCSSSGDNQIDVSNKYGTSKFQGPVECSPQGGGSTTQQSSSTTGTTTQQDDGDGDKDDDGIIDTNDNCPNLPNTRCYKEGDTALVVHNRNR